MEKENKKIEELNGMELIRLIYEEVKKIRKEFNEKIDAKFNYLDEKIYNSYKELDEKINNNFKYLDEKIENTKNTLVTEIVEEFNNFSTTTTKLINSLENKMDNEINERKTDISKVKDFNKIILNDFGSRISILEEESEKYNLN